MTAKRGTAWRAPPYLVRLVNSHDWHAHQGYRASNAVAVVVQLVIRLIAAAGAGQARAEPSLASAETSRGTGHKQQVWRTGCEGQLNSYCPACMQSVADHRDAAGHIRMQDG